MAHFQHQFSPNNYICPDIVYMKYVLENGIILNIVPNLLFLVLLLINYKPLQVPINHWVL